MWCECMDLCTRSDLKSVEFALQMVDIELQLNDVCEALLISNYEYRWNKRRKQIDKQE